MIPINPASRELVEIFQQEFPDPRTGEHVRPGTRPATPRICYFADGEHYGPPGCDHERIEDELGKIHPRGWTVQTEAR